MFRLAFNVYWCCREYRYKHDIRINSFLNVWALTIILVLPITFHRKQEISLLQNQVYQLPPSTTSSFCPYLGNYLHNQQIIAWTRDHAGLVVDIGRSLKRCDVSVHRNVASFQFSFQIKLISYYPYGLLERWTPIPKIWNVYEHMRTVKLKDFIQKLVLEIHEKHPDSVYRQSWTMIHVHRQVISPTYAMLKCEKKIKLQSMKY